MRPGSNGGHQHGRNGTGNAWHRVVLCNPEAVVTPFLGPLGPFQHPVQGVRSRKPVPCVGTVENGNPGKGKGHTLGTTPGEEEFRSGTRVRSPGPGTVQPHVCGRPRAGPRVPRSRVLSRSCGTHGRGGGARVDVSSPGQLSQRVGVSVVNLVVKDDRATATNHGRSSRSEPCTIHRAGLASVTPTWRNAN